MADLNPLIRVRKHAVEQKQKFLAELYRQAEELDNQKKTLLDQLESERKNLEGLPVDFLIFFSTYEHGVRERVEEIDHAREILEQRIEKAREDIRSAFAELKKIEITQESREAEEIKALERKLSIELDDIAIDRFRRNGDN